MKSRVTHLFAKHWPAALITAIWLFVFLPMMTGHKVAGFRDSTQLYYPLFQFIDSVWAGGEIPLWNPYDNFGAPLLADGTSSVLYPGKLIFLCRFLEYPARYGIYLAIHVLIAAAGTYWLARTLAASRSGATLAAISYAFGGSFFFQLCNVVFLVSGAWLPFAIGCVWKLTQTLEYKWAIAAGVCCALMILGGDPQMVYHVGLIAVATVGGSFMRRRRRQLKTRHAAKLKTVRPGAYRWWLAANLRIVAMILVTIGLSAVQLLPTYVWSQRSERINTISPQNIYGAFQFLVTESAEFIEGDGTASWEYETTKAIHNGLVAEPDPNLPASHRYQFSLPPWSLAELIWPNVSGKPYPVYSRWTDALPGAERVWVPSLYAGLATVLLAIGAARLWGRRRREVWLTRVGLFFAVAAFGWFGAVWLVNESLPVFGATQIDGSNAGPQVGGIYWAMTLLLPKYFAFRYPAKLFVIATLCLSVLAGVSLRRDRIRLPRWLVRVTIAGCLLGPLVLYSGWALNRMNGIGASTLFGPFNISAAKWDLSAAFAHSLIVVTLIVLLARWQKKTSPNPQQENSTRYRPALKHFAVAIVLLTSIDILVANRWMTLEIESECLTRPTRIAAELEQLDSQIRAEDGSPRVEPLCIYRSRDNFPAPGNWTTTSSENRISEIATWQRETLMPKNHLEHRVRLLGSFTSIWPSEYEVFVRDCEGWIARIDQEMTDQSSHSGFDAKIVPGNGPECLEIQPTSHSLWQRNFSAIGQNVNRIGNVQHDNCRITEFTNQRIGISSKNEKDSTLYLFLLEDDGWKAKIVDNQGMIVEGVDIKRYRSFSRKLEALIATISFQKPGEYRTTLTYDPIEFRIGAWISALSWLTLIGTSLIWVARKRQRRQP